MTRAIIFSLLTILSASAARADVLTDCTESPQSDVRVAACTQIINDKAASWRDKAAAYVSRGVDRTEGALVVVRPDQHVGHVLPLDGFDQLAAYFDAFMLPAG